MTEQTYKEYKNEFHHPWCSFFAKPRQGCKRCEKFYDQYPINDENANVKSFENSIPYTEKEPVKKSKIKHFLTSLAMIPVSIIMLIMCILLLETPEQVVARWLYWWKGDNY